jgi:hypothetical protein
MRDIGLDHERGCVCKGRRQATAATWKVEDDAGSADPLDVLPDQLELAPRAAALQQSLAVAQVVGRRAIDVLVFPLVARALLVRLRLTPGFRGAAYGEQRDAVEQGIAGAATCAVDRGGPDRQACRAAGADQQFRKGRDPGAVIDSCRR